MKNVLEKEIDILKIDKDIIKILINNNIDTIYKLCNYSRMELANIGLNNNQINKIIVSVQLQGLDLKPNHAKRNSKIDDNEVLVNKKS